MELTKQQLQRVAHYLNVKSITYIDLRMEVFDHIVSDIEAKMMTENLEFETVFYKVTDTWNRQLKETSSFYFGVAYSLPKIVMEKAKKSFKVWFFLSLFTYFISYVLVDKMKIVFSKNIENSLFLFFQIITVSCIVLIIWLLIKKNKNKQKTTYSFILKTQIWNILLGCIVLFYLNFNFLNQEGNLNPFPIGMLTSFVFSTYTYFFFYRKHRIALEKYKNL